MGFPEAVVVTRTGEERAVFSGDGDVGFGENGLASIVAELTNGKEGVVGQAGEYVGEGGGMWQAREVDVACVCGPNAATVW